MDNQNREKGFTLIEVLIAMTLLVIGILAVASMQIASLGGNSQAIRVTEATTWAGDEIETVMSRSYNDPALDRTVPLGIDDPIAMNTALNDLTTAHAKVPQPNQFDIFWNVANYSLPDGTPKPNIKTIRVIVVRTDKGGQVKRLAVDYLKTNDS